MKIFKIIFVVILSLNSLESFAQNTKISSYTFGEGLNFKNENGSTVKLQGYLQPYFESKGYSEYDGRENRYRMRRMRLRLTGTSANEKFSYRFQVDLAGADEGEDDINNYLLDAYISYDVTNRIEVSLGQRATYTDNRELFMSSIALQLAERSRLTSAFATIREFGLFVRGNFKTGGGSYVKPAFVLTNGDGSNVFGKDHGGLKIGGRVDFLPFGLFRNKGQFRQPDMARELTPKLVIGVQFSQNNGMSSRRGRGSGDILYLNAEDEETLPDYTKYGADFMFKYKGFSVLGEFVKSKAIVPGDITQRIRNDGTNSTTFTVDGVQDIDSYVRGRMVLGEAYNIQGGYLFKNGISVDARYTYLNADDNSFLNNATVYNRPKYYTLGVSKYLSRSYGAKIQASYTLIDGSLGINNNDGDPITGDENLIRVILTLAF
jgi:hypothetical protein